jgi:hypothetical protein
MNPTVLGAVIGVGGSTVAQAVAGFVSGRRHRRTLNEGRLRELAQVIDAADIALTDAHHHLGSGASLAREIGALGGNSEDRWQRRRQDVTARTVDDLNSLWSRSNLIRLRVAEDHEVWRAFDRATEAVGQATTVMEELLEVGLDRQQREPIWRTLREARNAAVDAQTDFEAAARGLLGPRIGRVSRKLLWPLARLGD